MLLAAWLAQHRFELVLVVGVADDEDGGAGLDDRVAGGRGAEDVVVLDADDDGAAACAEAELSATVSLDMALTMIATNRLLSSHGHALPEARRPTLGLHRGDPHCLPSPCPTAPPRPGR